MSTLASIRMDAVRAAIKELSNDEKKQVISELTETTEVKATPEEVKSVVDILMPMFR